MSTSLHRKLLHAANSAQTASKVKMKMQTVLMPWLPSNARLGPPLVLLLLALAQRVVTALRRLAKQPPQHQQTQMLSTLMTTWMSRQFTFPRTY